MALPSFSSDARVRPPLRADETTTLRAFLCRPHWERHTARDDTPEELFALFDEAVRRADAVISLVPGPRTLVGAQQIRAASSRGTAGRGR